MHLLPLLTQAATDPRSTWIPVILLIVIGLLFVIGTLVMSVLVGPSRTGPAKQTTYESGMVPIGTARQRFNVRFYLMAMIFLVFDVEIVFFYPWAVIFPQAIAQGWSTTTILLVEMFVFVGLLLVAYIYAWGKGVFRWD
ncbi:MAG TPA: NADH-quinone oxidoreductase subunit A [Tepidisphaeraceae bacterium]|nr:NADH-quinone oxidoreductase subunit A [Tepidisphaeraceae bacterium]